MIDIKIIFYILLIHFLADFGLQTHEQAVKKSHSVKHLFFHVLSYTFVWAVASSMIFDKAVQMSTFCAITFCLHFATDFFTSKLSNKFFKTRDFHNGFVIIGCDQLAHYIQLFLTYYYLSN